MSHHPIRSVQPPDSTIVGTAPMQRTIHRDPRGFLMETLRADETQTQGDLFAMSYVSLTLPGKYRDVNQWHVHQHQTDRFFVPLGELVLALYDSRAASSSRGTLEAIRMTGAAWQVLDVAGKEEQRTYVVSIPPGVYHCLGNLSRAPSLLVNFPTRMYSPEDEGRVAFDTVRDPTGEPLFSWSRVVSDLPSGAR